MTSAVLGPVPGHEAHDAAGHQLDAAVGEAAGADLRAREVGEHADRAADLGGDLAHHRQPVEVVVERAVAEVEAHDVDAGAEQRLEPGRVVAAGPSVATIFVRRVTIVV